MKAEIVTFPWGGAEGLLVLRLDAESEPFDPERVRSLAGDLGNTGVFGLWLADIDDWTAPELREFVAEQAEAQRPVVAVRMLQERIWPIGGCEFVVDASAAAANSSVRDLALWLNEHSHASPSVQDLVVQLERDDLPPPAQVLDMLADFVSAQDLNYLYMPVGYPLRPLLIKTVSRCGSRWAIRTATG